MSLTMTTKDAAAEAIEDLLPRVAAMVRSLTHPHARALGSWNAIETAVHLSHVCDVDHKAICGQANDIFRQLGEFTIPRISLLTQEWVNDDDERDPAAVAQRFEVARANLSGSLRRSREDPHVKWLGDAIIPTSAVAWHCVEEILVHGWDIAHSQGAPWPIRQKLAVAVLHGAVVPLLRALPATFVNERAAAGFRGSLELRLRGHDAPVYLTFEEGAFRVDTRPRERVDVHLSFDPPTYILLMMGRLSPLSALIRGKATVWGRRPWYAQKFRTLLRHP